MKKTSIWLVAAALTLSFSILPAQAGSIVIGGGASLAEANQLALWLGEGDLALTRIFGASPGSPEAFHAAADGRGRTFTIATVLFGGLVYRVGGYNPLSWDSSYDYHYSLLSRDAFVFNLTTGLKLAQAAGPEGTYQTFNHPFHGPEFGAGADLYFLSSDGTTAYPDGYAFGYSYGSTNVFGLGFSQFTTTSLDVFTMTSVPEPSSFLLLGGGLLALLGVSRHKLAIQRIAQ